MFVDKKTGQLSLFEVKEDCDKNTRLWKEFMAFHNKHPHIYESFKERIFEAIKEGRDLYAMQTITENDRWDKKFRISNNHAAYYARLFIEDFPDYKSFFRLRPIRKD